MITSIFKFTHSKKVQILDTKYLSKAFSFCLKQNKGCFYMISFKELYNLIEGNHYLYILYFNKSVTFIAPIYFYIGFMFAINNFYKKWKLQLRALFLCFLLVINSINNYLEKLWLYFCCKQYLISEICCLCFGYLWHLSKW